MTNRMATLHVFSSVLMLALMTMTTKVATHCVDVSNCSCFQDNANNYIADCSRKQLLFVPNFQRNVTSIDLSFNIISTLLPGKYITVKPDLSDKQMKNKGPFTFLSHLKFLDLSNNKLLYKPEVFPVGVFEGLVNLEALDIQHNNNYNEDQAKLSYPESLSELTKLKRLRIDGLDATLNVSRILPTMQALEELDISGLSGMCSMKKIESHFLQNVSNLVHVNITACQLTHIENETFHSLPRLKYLNVSDNDQLTFAALSNITYGLQYTNITSLDISGLHCLYGVGTYLYANDITGLQNTSLETIVCNSNRLAQVEKHVLHNFPSTLKYFSARDNRLTFGMYAFEMNSLTSLLRLDLSGQYTSHDLVKLSQFDDCNDWRCPPRRNPSKLEKKSMQSHAFHSSDSSLSKMVGKHKKWIIYPPPNLTDFVMEDADLAYKIPIIYFSANSIQKISFKRNFLYSWIGPVTNMDSLLYLDLSYNYCSNVSTFFFEFGQTLQTLLISNNLLGFVLILDSEGTTFERLKNLEILDLSANRIAELGSRILKNQVNMITLNLSSNLLRKFDVKIGHMEKLQYLDLSDNQLPYLNPSSISEINSLIARTNLSIDLSNNPFQCSCEKLEFLRWMTTNKRVFSMFEKYQCSLSNGTTVSFYNLDSTLVELEEKCASYVTIIVGVVSAIILTLSVAIGGLVYRYRWKLRYLFYMVRNNFTLNDHVEKGRHDRLLYKYDAFISHADEDSEFVLGDLLQNMEETRQYTICLHQRDFRPGRDIAGNITNAIHNSHKTVVILSPDFLRSNWCMFEFNMARMEGIYSRENTNNIFLVFYKHVRPEELPLQMMEFINSKTYLEYPGDIDGDDVFWDKMAAVLAE